MPMPKAPYPMAVTRSFPILRVGRTVRVGILGSRNREVKVVYEHCPQLIGLSSYLYSCLFMHPREVCR